MVTFAPSTQVHTLVSCPAKVLIGGGYLVLDPAYTGTVVATSSRFYAYFSQQTAQKLGPGKSNHGNAVRGIDDCSERAKVLIIFRSPQFLDAEWIYLITWPRAQGPDDGDITIDQLPDKNGLKSENLFLENAALHSFRFGVALTGARCLETVVDISGSEESGDFPAHTVILVADNDFYSQPRGQSDSPPFNALHVPITKVHKTGLGSSAAMVTSVCGAMLLRLVPSLLDDQEAGELPKRAKHLIHNLAQYVHSTAQGKIGSGFDVSAAVWGTHVYRRFAEECLNVLPSETASKGSPAKILAFLDPQTNPRWTNQATAPQVTSFTLPPLTTLMLADVDAGSHTPSMVANAMWNHISTLNERLGELCIKLNERFARNQPTYITQVNKLSQQPNMNENLRAQKSKPVSQEEDTYALFMNLRATMQETRKWMQKMGEASDVPIEPPSQTELLDACDNLPGVVGSGVPGAGGYDAIWVLVFSPSDCIETGAEGVRNLWKGWKKVSVRALSKDACVEGGQSERPSGIRIENLEHVKGLADVLNGSRRMSTVATTE